MLGTYSSSWMELGRPSPYPIIHSSNTSVLQHMNVRILAVGKERGTDGGVVVVEVWQVVWQTGVIEDGKYEGREGGIEGTHQNERRHSSSSTVGVGEYIFLRCAPTSSAILMPAPMTGHVDWGAVVPCRNSAISCRPRNTTS